MVKRATKKKARTKARRKAVVSTANILSEAPINAAHKKALTAAGRAAKAQERAAAVLEKATMKRDAEDARVKNAVATAKTKKTAAAKNAVVKAKTAKAKAMESFKTAKAGVKDAGAAVKVALGEINAIKKRETAKEKAVAVFLAKWEKSYDRTAAAKAKKKVRRKRKVRPAAE